jgi:hypothetical protein
MMEEFEKTKLKGGKTDANGPSFSNSPDKQKMYFSSSMK